MPDLPLRVIGDGGVALLAVACAVLMTTKPSLRGRRLVLSLVGIAIAIAIRIVVDPWLPSTQPAIAGALAAVWFCLALTHHPMLGGFWRQLWIPVILAAGVGVVAVLDDVATIPQAAATIALGAVTVTGVFVVGHARRVG